MLWLRVATADRDPECVAVMNDRVRLNVKTADQDAVRVDANTETVRLVVS
jgi:hypothetical protein